MRAAIILRMAEHRLHVVARIVAKPGSVALVRRELTSLLEPTRREQGCILYELMQNKADPTDFTFYEEWTDDGALDVHAVSPHIRTTFERLEGHLAAAPDVRRYSRVGV